jgi:broad-specificity NMP kinase
MNKVCVLITGTNAVGKSSLAKELIATYGGIRTADKLLTCCNDQRICFAGKYDLTKKYGGVDGFNQTKCLESVVRKGLMQHDVVICEGMYLHTFGMNLLNAAFAADRQLVVFLYAPVREINRRLIGRSQTGIANDAVWKKQQATAVSAKKWASIGVPVLSYDTSITRTADIAQQVASKIEELCTK